MSKATIFISSNRRGLFTMLMACLMFSIMNTIVYAITLAEPTVSTVMISFMRVLINGLVIVIPALIRRDTLTLFGDFSYSLWLRGLFGATALMLSFASIARIGVGESAFLGASSGLFVALLSPWVLGQKNSWLSWIAVLGSIGGVFLLFKNNHSSHDVLGRAMALAGGFLAALAYLMVARAGRKNSTQTVIFYFCLVALCLHGGYFALYGCQLPINLKAWELLGVTGLMGSGAQHAMTRAYQSAPASLVTALGYSTPVLSLLWGMLFFAQIPNTWAITGSAMILLFGVLLPFCTKSLL
jgi:S-adenosylmethionine uptake transporter